MRIGVERRPGIHASLGIARKILAEQLKGVAPVKQLVWKLQPAEPRRGCPGLPFAAEPDQPSNPVAPSVCSLRMSACPTCRADSSIMCT
jgi:hypothetical protein